MKLPRAWRSVDVTFLTVPFLEMALKGSWHIEALKAEGADKPLLRRVPILTILVCTSRRVCHRLGLLGNVLQEIHLLWREKISCSSFLGVIVGLRPPLFSTFTAE